uniref:Nuclear envelope integral membrane protein 1-like isoform X4 n=1 Tax=Hirondellea gigas TaxID=1518452 RepID=A0A6A7FU06_9CRUS
MRPAMHQRSGGCILTAPGSHSHRGSQQPSDLTSTMNLALGWRRQKVTASHCVLDLWMCGGCCSCWEVCCCSQGQEHSPVTCSSTMPAPRCWAFSAPSSFCCCLLPEKSGALTFMLGGSGLFLYLLQLLYTNFVFLINQYYAVFLGYIAVTGLVSFGVMYRSGGLSDGRSLQLLQWSLQCCGLLAVYFSSQYREATLALVLLLLLHHNTPAAVSNTLKSVWRRRFPPKVQLLTEEEFLQQGNLATTEALHSLRDHCKSPDCNAWRTMSRLNTPLRFAEFVEGSSHLQDEELLHYELSQYSDSNHRTPPRLTDDEDDLTDDGDY